jgi:O-antigen/teichoic acid export membrane protein
MVVDGVLNVDAPNSLSRRLLIASTATVAYRLLGALGGVLIARSLGPEARGTYAVLLVALIVASSAATGGLQFWIAREVATRGITNDVLSVFWTAAIGVVVLCVLCAAAAIVLSAPAALAALGAAFVSGSVIGILVLALLVGRHNTGGVAIATLCGSAAYLAVAVGVVYSDSASVGLGLVASVCSNWCVVVAGLLVARPASPAAFDTRSTFSAVRSTGVAALADVVVLLGSRVDVAIVAWLVSASGAGWYAVAYSVAELLAIGCDAVAQVTFPMVAVDRVDSPTATMVRMIVLAAVPGLIVVGVASGPAIRMAYGTSFSRSVSLVVPLAVGVIAMGIWKVLCADLVARGDRFGRIGSAAFGLFVMGAVDLALVPRFGLPGAAIGSITGSVAAMAVAAQRSCSTAGRSWSELFVPTRDDIGVLEGLAGRISSRLKGRWL